MYSAIETSVEKWAAGKYCFCTEAKREGTKQAEEEVADVSTSATHTHIERKKHAARVLIFPCSLF